MCLSGDLCVTLTGCVGVNDSLALGDADVQGSVAMETQCISQQSLLAHYGTLSGLCLLSSHSRNDVFRWIIVTKCDI